MPRSLSALKIDQQNDSRRSKPTIDNTRSRWNFTLQNQRLSPETRAEFRRKRRPRSLRQSSPCRAQTRQPRRRQQPRQARRCQIRRSRKRLLKEMSYDAGRVSFYENQTTTEIKKYMSNYIINFGHCADPALPDWKNALNYVASSPAAVFFKRVINKSCHVLCKNPPRGATKVVGIGLKFCIKKIRPPYCLKASFE